MNSFISCSSPTSVISSSCMWARFHVIYYSIRKEILIIIGQVASARRFLPRFNERWVCSMRCDADSGWQCRREVRTSILFILRQLFSVHFFCPKLPKSWTHVIDFWRDANGRANDKWDSFFSIVNDPVLRMQKATHDMQHTVRNALPLRRTKNQKLAMGGCTVRVKENKARASERSPKSDDVWNDRTCFPFVSASFTQNLPSSCLHHSTVAHSTAPTKWSRFGEFCICERLHSHNKTLNFRHSMRY